MPKLVSEISSGVQFQRSSDENGLADSMTRVFRVLLNQPGESFQIQDVCQVRIGDRHPINQNIYCNSFSANFEGESRMAVLCTFNYQTRAGSNSQEDPQSQPPDIRPANYSFSTSLMEVPASSWRPVFRGLFAGVGNWSEVVNEAGDIYDGITKMAPVTTITIEQFEVDNVARHARHAGKVNALSFSLESLSCEARTVMFRGVSCRPSVEPWGSLIYRGWQCSYEFAHRPNRATWNDGTGVQTEDVGWDILIPASGFNVTAFTPGAGGAERDPFGQPLKHSAGRIGLDGGLPLLPQGITDGNKVRAMVKVHEYEDGGISQTPSAQPIPLNDDGTPRINTANPKVLVKRYQIHEDMEFEELGIRLRF